MNCPGCGQSMQQHTVEGNYGVQVEIDACRSCSGFWFDRKEHLQLTPGSTLELIRLMGPHRSTPSALPQVLSCPRCGERLVNTTDIQRNTRFNYFRCPQEDGHFITLFQFLREKNIVRNLEQKLEEGRSEEHTSELQSPDHLVCRLLLEKKKKTQKSMYPDVENIIAFFI